MQMPLARIRSAHSAALAPCLAVSAKHAACSLPSHACRGGLWQRRSGNGKRCSHTVSNAQQTAEVAVAELLQAVEGTERGVRTSPQQLQAILAAVQRLQDLDPNAATTDGPIDATWELVWTTEKETLFILKQAGLFRTQAAGVYQVVDTANSRLQNVITFANGASFVVDSRLDRAGPQRLAFRFTAARLNTPGRTWSLPPFGKGWFDTVYLDDELRVAKDIRGDTLVVRRGGPPRTF